MEKNKKRKQLVIAFAVIILLAIGASAYNSALVTNMPKVNHMKLSAAIGKLEDAKIIKDDDYITKIRLVDANGKEVKLNDFQEFQKYEVVKQSPAAGMKFRYRASLFSDEGATDLAELTVEQIED